MKFDTTVLTTRLSDASKIAHRAEELGFHGLWASETQHNPFLPLALAAANTTNIELGTAVAIAFARNPMDVAYVAWDLAQLSNGRFILGLGTQVQPHIERRFSMPWGPAAPKLREFILAVRHIWDSWQNGTKLDFRGEYYTHTLMSPFFNPGRIKHPNIPIYIAGVNEHLCRLAGEVADGFHIHSYHTPAYLQAKIIPWIEAGATQAGRQRSDITLSTAVFAVTGHDEATMAMQAAIIRQQIAFYASTPTYRSVMEHHGWHDVGEELSGLAKRQQWDKMPALITDEILNTFAVVAPPDKLAAAVKARYAGFIDRISYYREFAPGFDEDFWRQTIADFRS